MLERTTDLLNEGELNPLLELALQVYNNDSFFEIVARNKGSLLVCETDAQHRVIFEHAHSHLDS